jgi:undecaprenyl diphosphate synthase
MKIPRHVAIIMDGNGRWARSQGLPRVRGHEAGAESVREIVRASRELGVEVLTLYSFSTENWRRPADEVTALMGLLKRYVFQERAEILDNGIQLRAIGQIERLPAFVRVPLKRLIRDSRRNTGMVLNLALSYGSRAEMLAAVQHLAAEVAAGRLKPDQISEEMFSASLFTGGLPDPDLVIRTSGEFRLSNFLLWQVAYAEIYITDIPWPEFRRPQLEEAFASFGDRERRFGKTGEQVQAGGGRA